MKKAYFNDVFKQTQAVINGTKTQFRRIVPQKALDAWNKASDLAAAATKTDRATYEEVRQACIDAIEWQAERDKLMLDAKDESIIQMEMTVFERVQSVCRYRCAKIGDTYKCANGKSFGEPCSKQNCPIIK